MNFLGHLYLSGNNHQRMLHNLYGDFVKGKDLSRFPEEVQQGIRLHRSIDDYIDHHPEVLKLIHLLQPELPKVAAVAVDLYFDHLLARDWKRFHQEDLNTYLAKFYQSIDLEYDWYTPEFKTFMGHFVRRNWVSYYPLLEGLEKACQGVASRLSFQTRLSDGRAVFEQFQTHIEHTFEQYMLDAVDKFGLSDSNKSVS